MAFPFLATGPRALTPRAELDGRDGKMSQRPFLASRNSPQGSESEKESKKSKSCLSRDQGWACDMQGRCRPNPPVYALVPPYPLPAALLRPLWLRQPLLCLYTFPD